MSAAVDLNILDARIQRELLASYRDMIHKAVDDFVDALAEDLLSDRKMTLMEITQAILKAKPSGAKGTYIKRVTVSATMGPGFDVDVNAARAAVEKTSI